MTDKRVEDKLKKLGFRQNEGSFYKSNRGLCIVNWSECKLVFPTRYGNRRHIFTFQEFLNDKWRLPRDSNFLS